MIDVGVTVEPELIERLLADAVAETGILPLCRNDGVGVRFVGDGTRWLETSRVGAASSDPGRPSARIHRDQRPNQPDEDAGDRSTWGDHAQRGVELPASCASYSDSPQDALACRHRVISVLAVRVREVSTGAG